MDDHDFWIDDSTRESRYFGNNIRISLQYRNDLWFTQKAQINGDASTN